MTTLYRCTKPPPRCEVLLVGDGGAVVNPGDDVYETREQCEQRCVSAATAVAYLFGGLLLFCFLAYLLYVFARARPTARARGASA